MGIAELLPDEAAAIVDEAWRAISRLEHYRRDGEESGRRRVEALYRHVARAIRTLDLDALRAHAARVALHRLEAGYDRAELQAAFSALEDALWRRASQLSPSERSWALGLVGTACADARAAVERAYDAAAAARGHAPFVDLTPIFRQGDPSRDRPEEELVYPV